MTGSSQIRIYLLFTSSKRQLEQMEHERRSDWLGLFEQQRRSILFGNQLWPSQGQADFHVKCKREYQDGLTSLE